MMGDSRLSTWLLPAAAGTGTASDAMGVDALHASSGSAAAGGRGSKPAARPTISWTGLDTGAR
jgi:hypothetical protein